MEILNVLCTSGTSESDSRVQITVLDRYSNPAIFRSKERLARYAKEIERLLEPEIDFEKMVLVNVEWKEHKDKTYELQFSWKSKDLLLKEHSDENDLHKSYQGFTVRHKLTPRLDDPKRLQRLKDYRDGKIPLDQLIVHKAARKVAEQMENIILGGGTPDRKKLIDEEKEIIRKMIYAKTSDSEKLPEPQTNQDQTRSLPDDSSGTE
jgi:hypothetical protein